MHDNVQAIYEAIEFYSAGLFTKFPQQNKTILMGEGEGFQKNHKMRGPHPPCLLLWETTCDGEQHLLCCKLNC